MSFRFFSCLAALALADPASALTLDFSEFSHGDFVTGSKGVTIDVQNVGGGPNDGVAFDTNLTVSADPDLQRISPSIRGGETGWKSGNLAPDTDLGRVLIIQENSCDLGGYCGRPDDEGSRPAGNIDFDFSGVGSFTEFSMDIVDIESRTAEPGVVIFKLGSVEVASVSFMSFLDDPTVEFGNNSANRVQVLSGVEFDRAIIHLGGSGAIDNVVVDAVPEPTAALLFAIGALALRTRVVGARLR